MAITFDENKQIFHLTTKNTSYIIGLVDGKFLTHLHYGKRIESIESLEEIFFTRCVNFASGENESDVLFTGAASQFEYRGFETDYRTPALGVTYHDGGNVTRLRYQGHEIVEGKPGLPGLPAVYTESDEEAQTLIVTLTDRYTGLTAELIYTAMYEYDAITRSVKFTNHGKHPMMLDSAMSATVDFCGEEFDFVHLHGAWARERHIERLPVGNGNVSIDSKRGASSHHHNPFFALASKNATETHGDVYGFNLIYSGNFLAGAEKDAWNTTRAYIGINPFGFGWKLCPNESFQTPEAVLVYSDRGFGTMSRRFHKLYRTRLARGKFRDSTRPILLNTWEAVYYTYTEEQILNIAKEAKELGIELLVLDDGWFSGRNDGKTSLGDWYPDKQKLPNGIKGIAEKVNALGMQFGLWFEPEIVSPESELYKTHPDWVMHTNDRPLTPQLHRLVLDLSRDDVCDFLIDAVSNILENAPISYVKWDMNRNMNEVGSCMLTADTQKEAAHRYILGLYRILETITARFPNILFESCSGGGGRFDGGMLYYMPQTWTSDDTDAVERLYIQHGTSLAYPASAMAAHVSEVPNHQVHRTTPMQMRSTVAMCGRFGYELAPERLTDEEKEDIKRQIVAYRKVEEIIHKGDMYRLKSPFDGNLTAWQYVAEDRKKFALCIFNILCKADQPTQVIKLMGLEENGRYKNTTTGEIYTGSTLMHIGFRKFTFRDFDAEMLVFEKVEE